ncbi:MAG: purine-nucleoside phosphorylase, partial [Prevotellaceae bacterium]|nr:purine-nucleoside phosphorylase [Prevotellaceae bacterium]
TGIILGTGLGGLVNKISNQEILEYADIPNFPVSTVEGHSGRLIFGELGGKNVMAMQGRFHFYEGYDMKQVTFPVRVMKELNIKCLFVSNASGGVNPDFEIGDLMVLNDHINLMPNPLLGKNRNELGVRFPDMSEAYSKKLIALADETAAALGIKLRHGVYVGTTGPTFETPSEYRYFRIIGGDAVGMSTVPEVIVARHSNIPIFAISIITDLGVEGKIIEVSHEEVQKVGAAAEVKMTELIRKMLEKL